MIFIINRQKTYPLLLIATLSLSSMLIKKKKKKTLEKWSKTKTVNDSTCRTWGKARLEDCFSIFSEGPAWVSKCLCEDRFYCCSAVQLYLTLCDSMDSRTPGFPILHHLLEFAQTHVHWGSDATQPSHALSSPSPKLYKIVLVLPNIKMNPPQTSFYF